ncbi:DNA primase [Xanthomonas phage Xaa_vB_phi31]|uniref:DNA primase n=1 Tax=Xanthomonas phage Xaa_vB_phi31 TaxID=2776752 RepID=A0A868BZ12_9CAUD|nr:DNA primase [Xanthomonas phage Xaa_vB_phi31]
MGWIHTIANVLFDSELARAKESLKVKGILIEHHKNEAHTQRSLHEAAKRMQQLHEDATEQVVRENKSLKSKVESLIQENCSLTREYMVPAVVASVTGRTRKCPAYFQQLYGGPYLHCGKGGSLTACDFAALELRVAAACPSKKKSVYWMDTTMSDRYVYVYGSHQDKTARAGHIARFNNDDHGKAAASKYVDFLNAE